MVIQDPFLLQQNSLDYVNLKRIKNVINQKVSKNIIQYKIGNYVLLAGLTKTSQGSKSNVTPKSQDIFKIIDILKNGFGLNLKNLRTNSIQTVTHEKVRLLNLQDLVAQNITETNFFNTPQLLEKRGYFQRGKSKVRLSLLNQADCNEEESITNWHEPILKLPQTEKPAKFTVTKPQPPAAILEDAAVDIEDDISTQFSQKSENLTEQQNEQLGENQDQPNFEILPEVELKSREKLAAEPFPHDPELVNLGGERKTTKYSLRDKPDRN